MMWILGILVILVLFVVVSHIAMFFDGIERKKLEKEWAKQQVLRDEKTAVYEAIDRKEWNKKMRSVGCYDLMR